MIRKQFIGLRFALLYFAILPCGLASAVPVLAYALKTEDCAIQVRTDLGHPRLTKLISRHGCVWNNDQSERLPDSVQVDGCTIPLTWKLANDQSIVNDRRLSLVYTTLDPPLKLTWEWLARANFGPIEHSIVITNLGRKTCWLPMQHSLSYSWQTQPNLALRHVFIEKGAGGPGEIGTHLVAVPARHYTWTGTSSTYANDSAKSKSREIIPWSFLQVCRSSGSRRPESGWYVGIESSARCSIGLERTAKSVRGSAGLNPVPGSFKTRIGPGENFRPPTVFLGASEGDLDDLSQSLSKWVKEVLCEDHAWHHQDFPLVTNNSWGIGMAIDEVGARRMIADAARLKFEMFHLDAGWFRGVGDWYGDEKRFPHGIAFLADQVHSRGMKFGLWVNWSQAGLDNTNGALNARDPLTRDWLVADLPAHWKTDDFRGRTIDLGCKPAHDWALKEVERLISDYKLDMLEHDGYLVAQGCLRKDHPHAVCQEDTARQVKEELIMGANQSNSTDVSQHAALAYYDIQARVREKHPDLLLEICNDGGRMVDFGSASHGDYFSITDSYDPLANRRAFWDASYLLPAAMLETYVKEWPTRRIENFRYMLRSGMMGWLTVMLDTSKWTEEQHKVAARELNLYKTKLRPFIREARLYHISSRPDGKNWDAVEYFDPRNDRGVVYAFRGSQPGHNHERFRLRGLDAQHQYRVHFQDASHSDSIVSGAQLSNQGLTLVLPTTFSSEIVFLDPAL